ncbi:hypothetical protein [Salinigranum halophilum]|uniref:hypothetical protein n=1 Tax=Salinigranum halophilum TaxID=2565931 RepID=UPI00137557AF|nr:hypothetical protein [Salinigranum halophilum]
MATCQGDVPITTKVDEPMREFVDGLADGMDISRSELLRRLLELYHQSEEGDLACPACAQSVRIQASDVALATDAPSQPSTMDESEGATTRVIGDDTPSNRQIADDDTASSDTRPRVSELETAIEEQQQKLGFLRRKMAAQERVLADLSESGVSSPRIERLEEQLAWTVDELQHMSPRIEALTQVSDLAEQGSCPDCGTELSEEQSFADLGGPSAIECSNCGSVAGYRT